jgi:hypothetical protein
MWVVSVTPRSRFSPRERTPNTQFTGGWVGFRAVLDTEVTGKIVCLCRGSNLDRPFIESVVDTILTELLKLNTSVKTGMKLGPVKCAVARVNCWYMIASLNSCCCVVSLATRHPLVHPLIALITGSQSPLRPKCQALCCGAHSSPRHWLPENAVCQICRQLGNSLFSCALRPLRRCVLHACLSANNFLPTGQCLSKCVPRNIVGPRWFVRSSAEVRKRFRNKKK